ncbi:proton-coupled zinc antiporter SLC30A2 isoform X2 [Hydra vulgaris]|uniref:Proton-coupled zinc antiporter SLC30A2 isoform X2 n=1 Tax=Hydra vulgaris TaxID=6087 RepID=A0ABM4BSB2_HYDVU
MERSSSFDGDMIYKEEHGSNASLLTNALEPPPIPIYKVNGHYCATEETSLHCHTKDTAKQHATRLAQRKLIVASIVCLLFMIGEFIGGYFSNSLAIMTDAAHLLSDFGSFMISLFALWLGTKKPSKKLSFGWHRAEVMGAFLSVLIIWVLTGVLVFEAIKRVMNHNYELDPVVMLITSGVGVVVNIILGIILAKTGHGHSHGLGGHNHSHGVSSSQDQRSPNVSNELSINNESVLLIQKSKSKVRKDLNVRAAFIHALGDLVQSIGVFFAALIIYFKPNWKIMDPICTFLFSLLVLFTTLTILKDILLVLMEGTPKGLDFKEVFEDLQNIQAVKMVHNLHLWSLTMDTPALSVHLAIDDSRSTHSVLREAQTLVSRKYDIHHSTIQVEKFQDQMENCSMCEVPKD